MMGWMSDSFCNAYAAVSPAGPAPMMMTFFILLVHLSFYPLLLGFSFSLYF